MSHDPQQPNPFEKYASTGEFFTPDADDFEELAGEPDEPRPVPSAPSPDAAEPVHAAATPPVSRSTPASAPIASRPLAPASTGSPVSAPTSPRPIFPNVMGLLMVAALAGSWVYSSMNAPTPTAANTSTSAPAVTPVTAEDAKPSSLKPTPLPEEVKSLMANVESLTKQTGDLKAAIEALPKAATPDDIKVLKGEIAQLAESFTPVSAKISDIDQRVSGLGKDVEGVRKEVTTLVQQPRPAPAAESVATANATSTAVIDAALNESAALFRQGKYGEALNGFRAIQLSAPDDARVWYYSALANGLANRQWKGDTETWVNRGIEREMAGTPDPAQIDALFAGLTSTTGKDWLAGYRRKARR